MLFRCPPAAANHSVVALHSSRHGKIEFAFRQAACAVVIVFGSISGSPSAPPAVRAPWGNFRIADPALTKKSLIPSICTGWILMMICLEHQLARISASSAADLPAPGQQYHRHEARLSPMTCAVAMAGVAAGQPIQLPCAIAVIGKPLQQLLPASANSPVTRINTMKQ